MENKAEDQLSATLDNSNTKQQISSENPLKSSQLVAEKQVEEVTQKLKDLTLQESQKNGEDLKPETFQAEPDQPQEYFTRDLIVVSKPNISFTKALMFPGSIDEVDINISLKDQILSDEDPKSTYLLRVISSCHNSEFDALDEYVFSVRSNERFEYFEEVRFRIKKKQKAQVKVAVKIPPVKTNYVIEGSLSIQLQNTVPLSIPIYAKCQIPKIICLKDLFDIKQQTSLIKIPAKKNIRMPPLPFKNLSNFNFIVEVETVTTQDFSKRPYDIICQNSVNCMANAPFFINLQLKTNMNYRDVVPKTDTIRKILILKIKNSSVHFSYPIEAYVYESTNTSNIS